MAENTKKTAEELKIACNEAYESYPNSCSHAAWYVIQKYKPEQAWMNANALVDHLSASSEWQEVQSSDLSTLASNGELVVGGLKETGHGHVIVVYPGDEKKRGGYSAYNKEIAQKGSYARAMSTSLGSWPGAKSNGDKTVWDPWAKDSKFNTVRFWKYIGTPKKDVEKKELKIKNNPEGARKVSQMSVVCTTPDVCKTPMGNSTPPVPYQIISNLSDSTSVSPNVRFKGSPAFLLDKSLVTKVTGDEAGTAGGVKSGKNVSNCEPVEGCQTFRINGKQVVAHGDKFKMNNGNTFGKAVFQG